MFFTLINFRNSNLFNKKFIFNILVNSLIKKTIFIMNIRLFSKRDIKSSIMKKRVLIDFIYLELMKNSIAKNISFFHIICKKNNYIFKNSFKIPYKFLLLIIYFMEEGSWEIKNVFKILQNKLF